MYIGIFLLILIFLCWFFYRKKIIKEIKQLKLERIELKQEKEELNNQIQANRIKLIELNDQTTSIQLEYKEIAAKRDELNSNFAKIFENETNLLNEKLDREAEKISQNFQKETQQYQQEYLEILTELTKDITNKLQVKKEELNSISYELQVEKERIKQIHKEQTKLEEVRLMLTESEIEEIKKLREVAKFIRDQEALNKVIWKVYYERPYNELMNRLFIDKNNSCGIYKITSMITGKVYIGQSVNIKERFRQHMKKGCGAEAMTKNKLYPVMYAEGIENFTYEIIRFCAPTELNKEERYWIDFYDSCNNGLNATGGNG